MSQVLEESRPARPRAVDVKKLPNADEAAVAAAQEAALRRKHHEHVTRNGLSWVVLAWFGAIHLGALAAPWYFTWTGLILLIGLHWLTGGIGVCLGYHRMLTHSSFATYPIVRYFIALIGTLAGEGTCLYWVANHRKHHAENDVEHINPRRHEQGKQQSGIDYAGIKRSITFLSEQSLTKTTG